MSSAMHRSPRLFPLVTSSISLALIAGAGFLAGSHWPTVHAQLEHLAAALGTTL